MAGDKDARPRILWDLLPLVLSGLAIAFSGLQWWEAHKQGTQNAMSEMYWHIDAKRGARSVALVLHNTGPGIARVQSMAYFVDGSPVGSLDHVIQLAKFKTEDASQDALEKGDALGVGEAVSVLAYQPAAKSEWSRGLQFLDEHFAALVTFCSASKKCTALCSREAACGK